MLGGQEFSDAAGGVTGTVEPLTLAWLNWSKVTYGLFGCAIIFDLIGVISDTDPFFFTASFWLLTAALASCLTPFLKWFRRNTPERTSERKRQFWHYLPQMLVTALFAMSWFLRYSFPTSPPTSALLLSFAPAAIALALTWFDGTLARCLRSLPTAAIVALAVLVAGIVSINLAQSAFFNRPEHDDSILTLCCVGCTLAVANCREIAISLIDPGCPNCG